MPARSPAGSRRSAGPRDGPRGRSAERGRGGRRAASPSRAAPCGACARGGRRARTAPPPGSRCPPHPRSGGWERSGASRALASDWWVCSISPWAPFGREGRPATARQPLQIRGRRRVQATGSMRSPRGTRRSAPLPTPSPATVDPPGGRMSYSFQPFLDDASSDWYGDDPLLQALLARYAPARGAAAEESLSAWGGEVAGPLSELAEESARPENRPASAASTPSSTTGGRGGPRRRPQGRPRRRWRAAQRRARSTAIRWLLRHGRTCTARTGRPAWRARWRAPMAWSGRSRPSETDPCTVRRREGPRLHAGRYTMAPSSSPRSRAVRMFRRTRGAVPEGGVCRLRGQKWFCSNIEAD